MPYKIFKNPLINLYKTLKVCLFLMIGYIFGLMVWDLYQNNLPANAWFKPYVYVQNFTEGDNPKITYIQNIKKSFQAEWFVTLYKGNKFICSGHGKDFYEKNKKPINNSMSLLYYMNPYPPCIIKSGKYKLVTNWIMKDINNKIKIQKLVTSEFNVTKKNK